MSEEEGGGVDLERKNVPCLIVATYVRAIQFHEMNNGHFYLNQNLWMSMFIGEK